MGLAAPRHVGSTWTRARTCVPCIGRRILNHCATRETHLFLSLKHSFIYSANVNWEPTTVCTTSSAWGWGYKDQLDLVLFLNYYYWSKIALQCCVSFCCTMKWISYMYTYMPSLLDLPPTQHPIPPILVIAEHKAELPVLYSRFQLAIYFIRGSVYILTHRFLKS